MKVSDNSTQPVGVPLRLERSAENQAQPSETVDKVSSTDAEQIRQAVAVVRKLVGASRSAKLVQLEAAVRTGAYPPNPSKIAEQILNEAVVFARLEAQQKH